MRRFLAWLIHGRHARPSDADRVLLALLDAGQPLSGTAVVAAAAMRGTAIHVLAGLERYRLVVSRWEILPPGADRPRRRYYALTEAGSQLAREIRKTGTNPEGTLGT